MIDTERRWKLGGYEAGKLKDGRWDVVKMRWWAALKRETYSKERCRRIAAILGETGSNVLSFL